MHYTNTYNLLHKLQTKLDSLEVDSSGEYFGQVLCEDYCKDPERLLDLGIQKGMYMLLSELIFEIKDKQSN